MARVSLPSVQVLPHRQRDDAAILAAHDAIGGRHVRLQEGGVDHAVMQLVGAEHFRLLGHGRATAAEEGQEQQGEPGDRGHISG